MSHCSRCYFYPIHDTVGGAQPRATARRQPQLWKTLAGKRSHVVPRCPLLTGGSLGTDDHLSWPACVLGVLAVAVRSRPFITSY